VRRATASQDCLGWVKCALKVASYFTLIIPALMHLAKHLLRSSPFYVISQTQSNYSVQDQPNDIQVKNFPDGSMTIGRFTDEGRIEPGVHIRNGHVTAAFFGFLDSSDVIDPQLCRLLNALITCYFNKFTTVAPVCVQQFFETIINDSFVHNALLISYGIKDSKRIGLYGTLDILTESGAFKKSRQTIIYRGVIREPFKIKIIKFLISYLERKKCQSLMETWICKALKDDSFSKDEFDVLETKLQKAVCIIAKLYHKRNFWSQAEKFFNSPTQTLCPKKIPDTSSLIIFMGEPYTTSLVCHTWADFTRNMYKRLTLSYFTDPEKIKHQYIPKVVDINIKNEEIMFFLPNLIGEILHTLNQKTNESNDKYLERMTNHIYNLNYSNSRNLFETIQLLTSNSQNANLFLMEERDR
jgi:hypothetical protein